MMRAVVFDRRRMNGDLSEIEIQQKTLVPHPLAIIPSHSPSMQNDQMISLEQCRAVVQIQVRQVELIVGKDAEVKLDAGTQRCRAQVVEGNSKIPPVS